MYLHFSFYLYSWPFDSKSHTLYFWRVIQQTENSVKATEFVMEGNGQLKNSFFIEFFLNGFGGKWLSKCEMHLSRVTAMKAQQTLFSVTLVYFFNSLVTSNEVSCLLSIPLRKGILAKPCKTCQKTEDIVALSFSTCTYKGKHGVDFRSDFRSRDIWFYDSMIF